MRALEDSAYRIGDAWLNVSERTVSRNGTVIRLRPKNFELLLFLIQRQERVATKEEIFREIWPNVAVTENTLVKGVTDLRKALGDDLRKPRLLKSIPKVGYQLVGVSEAQADPQPAPVNAVSPFSPAADVALEFGKESAVEDPVLPETPRQFSRKRLLQAAVAVAAALLAAVAVFGRLNPVRTAPSAGVARFDEAAWWKLDDGQGNRARDASGHGLDGNLSSGVSWIPKELGGGLNFSGFDAGVTGRTRGLLPAGDSARTISAWIDVQVPQLAGLTIFQYGRYNRTPTGELFTLGLNIDGTPHYGCQFPSGTLLSETRLSAGSWHMVTATYDGPSAATARDFVDGKLDREGRWASHPATKDDSVWKIGQYLVEGTDFRGAIKDVRIYNLALSPAQIAALYSCSAGTHDLGDYYYLPVLLTGFVRESGPAGAPSTPFHNGGKDFGGMQLALSDGSCAERRVRGADLGQDLRISMDVLLPTGRTGYTSNAGPYFRSRRAGAGDGILGGASAGYWVQLHSSGIVTVRRLNPMAQVAYSLPAGGYRPEAFNTLQMEARGSQLQVWLNGAPVQFDQGGRQVERVEIPPTWESSPWKGENQGAAGVAFSDENNRGQLSGQQIRNLSVTRLD